MKLSTFIIIAILAAAGYFAYTNRAKILNTTATTVSSDHKASALSSGTNFNPNGQ